MKWQNKRNCLHARLKILAVTVYVPWYRPRLKWSAVDKGIPSDSYNSNVKQDAAINQQAILYFLKNRAGDGMSICALIQWSQVHSGGQLPVMVITEAGLSLHKKSMFYIFDSAIGPLICNFNLNDCCIICVYLWQKKKKKDQNLFSSCQFT